MAAFSAVTAQLDGLLHLLDGLGPILRVGRLDCKIAELPHLVSHLLLFLQVIEALPILLGRGIVGLIERAGESVEGLRIIGVGLQRELPVRDRLGCFSELFEVLTQKELRVGLRGLHLSYLLQQFR